MEVRIMTNYYSTINEVVLTFSNISRNKDGFASIVARFERPNATGFDYAEWQLPCIAKRYLILWDMYFSFGRAKMANRLMFMYAKVLRQRRLQNFG